MLLERYACAALPGASIEERRTLERLLERPDPELAGYLLAGVRPEDGELAALIERILACRGAP